LGTINSLERITINKEIANQQSNNLTSQQVGNTASQQPRIKQITSNGEQQVNKSTIWQVNNTITSHNRTRLSGYSKNYLEYFFNKSNQNLSNPYPDYIPDNKKTFQKYLTRLK
jgi:hypothetical protein